MPMAGARRRSGAEVGEAICGAGGLRPPRAKLQKEPRSARVTTWWKFFNPRREGTRRSKRHLVPVPRDSGC
jgi:hypothetical protein